MSSWVSRMVEEIVKMNIEQQKVTPLDVGKALEEVWQDQMASWTNYDDDNHAEYLADTPPRLMHVLDEQYWTTVFSKITDLDTLRLLLNPVKQLARRSIFCCRNVRMVTFNKQNYLLIENRTRSDLSNCLKNVC